MKKKIPLLVLLLLTILTFFLYQNRDYLGDNPFSDTFAMNWPSFATSSDDGRLYFIDNSLRRVAAIRSDGSLQFTIIGGSKDANSFFYATELVCGETGSLFLHNIVYDNSGFFVEKEEIQEYSSSGRYVRTVYSVQYNETASYRIQRGQLSALSSTNGNLYWFDVDHDTISLHRHDIERDIHTKLATYELPEASALVQDLALISDNEWLICDKRGHIYRLNIKTGKKEDLYSAAAMNGDGLFSTPYAIGFYNDRVLFSDIGKGGICSLDSDGKTEVFSFDYPEIDGSDYAYFDFSVNQSGHFTTLNDDYIIQLSPEGGVKAVSSIHFDVITRITRYAVYIDLLIIGGLIIFLFYYMYVKVFNSKLPSVLSRGVLVVSIITITTVLVIFLISRNFSERYTRTVLDQTSQMVQLIPRTLSGDLLYQIEDQEDYMGKPYRTIRKELHLALNNNEDPWNNRYYFALYRVINDQLYGMMYLNDGITAFHPFSYYDEPGAYQDAQNDTISAETDSDNWGTWIYAVGPVYDSKGKVVALLEIGTDLFSFNRENRKLFKQIILEVVTLIVVFTLLMIELTFFNDILKKRHFQKLCSDGAVVERRKVDYSETYLARPLNFFFTTAVSISIAFVPVMMKELYEPLLSLPKDVVIALPISLEMLFFALALLAGGAITQKGSWKKVQFSGLVIAFTGLLLSALSRDMWFFFAARSITGLGSGLSFIAFRSYINHEENEEQKSTAYSHFYAGSIAGMNVGVVLGSFIAEQLDYQSAFYIGTALLLFTLLMTYLFLGPSKMENSEKESVPFKAGEALAFLVHPKVLLYFFLSIIPTYTAGMFIIYYFPLFANSNGIGMADIGRFFIINGLFIIYLGPVLSTYFKKRMGDKFSMLLGSLGWALALFVFALTGTIYGAVAALIIMGICEGFTVTAQNDYFLALKATRNIGEDRAVSYMEVAAKGAEIAAPIIFGIILTFGPLKGIAYLGVAIVVMTLLLFVSTMIKNNNG